MFSLITTLISLIFIQPPLLLLRLFWSLALLPVRIALLPSRIFFGVLYNAVSILWTVYGRILQLLYNFPALIPWTILVSVIATLTGYSLHHLSRFLNEILLSSPSNNEQTTTSPAKRPLPPPTEPRTKPLPPSSTSPRTPLLSPPPATSPPLPTPPPTLPTSPLAALLPPNSPLLTRYMSSSPTSSDPTHSRPQHPDRNISYRSQMRELMAERQEHLVALFEEEKARRGGVSPRLLSPGLEGFGSPPSPAGAWKDGQMRKGRDKNRPVSWPPLVVSPVESRKDGDRVHNRAVSGGSIDGNKNGYFDGTTVVEDRRDRRRGDRGGVLEASVFPSVPRTILEEDDESSDLDLY